VSKREVIAYAITHAGRTPEGKAIKGGPYMPACFQGPVGGKVPLERAARFPTSGHAVACISLNRKALPATARVIRIVRAGREASAVAVLRELVAWDEDPPMGEHDIVDICARARRVLAASGPDPSEVVRAALRETDAEEAFDRVAVKGKSMNAAADAIGVARANRVDAVDAYRKAGGK